MAIFNAVGDTVTFKGLVESVDVDAGVGYLDLWAESERGKTVTCKAKIAVEP